MKATRETVEWLAGKQDEAWTAFKAKTGGWRYLLWLALPWYGARELAEWSAVLRLYSAAVCELYAPRSASRRPDLRIVSSEAQR